MYFIKFPVGSTNIFPIANSTAGGQLVTEYNLRSRESVATDQNVQYMIGPSYVHSMEDYEVSIQTDITGVPTSSTILQISPGRGVFNGHFVELLTPISIDLQEANAQAKIESLPNLEGNLSIGLRVMYSTEPTMAGSMLVENKFEMYEGVQVVILPKEQFKLPSDVPAEPDKVTAHIKLADFQYRNGEILNIVNNANKVKNIDASRIDGIDGIVSDTYISKSKLDPKGMYIFAGYGSPYNLDTWCDAKSSLIVWDNKIDINTTKPAYEVAEFIEDSDGKVYLMLPHKQFDDGSVVNTGEPPVVDQAGNPLYIQPAKMAVPMANFNTNNSGMVDYTYTKHVKDVVNKINEIYMMPNGKQVGYIAELDDLADLPLINPNWKVGDYVLVGLDNTLGDDITSTRSPSTMYVLLPGIVNSVSYLTSTSDGTVPAQLTGIQLGIMYIDASTGALPPETSDSKLYNEYWDYTSNYRGTVGIDYFVVEYINGETVTKYFYPVATAGSREYSAAVYVTGEIPLATEDVIGGFYNVPSSQLDAGYVYLDDTGHLRLLDYSLLRSGTLAYQLGEDFEVPANIDNATVQQNLNEYVNQRVAFPNYTQTQNAENPNVINITMTLSPSEERSEINIYDIDSRFGTSVYLHIAGTADSNTIINIADCERIRIDSNISGTPIIKVYRCGLYYDASVIDYLNTHKDVDTSTSLYVPSINDITLWYERYESTDPNLVVNDMTVRCIDSPVITQNIDYWSVSTPNDNHYMYALQSITFGNDGSIIGFGILIRNATTANVAEGKSIALTTFTLPQSSAMPYPESSLTRQMSITGNFITSYPVDTGGYMIINTTFTAVSQVYDQYSPNNVMKGNISLYVDVNNIDAVKSDFENNADIDGWSSKDYHVFYGGSIS